MNSSLGYADSVPPSGTNDMARRAASWVVAGLALCAPLHAADEPPSEAVQPTQRRVVEEIVVTANRRTQNLQDIVGGIAVVGGEALEAAGAGAFEDYLFSIPGVDINSDGNERKIAVRGVGNLTPPQIGQGGSTSPIGLYLNDTPIQGNGILPDIALFDLQRIEVLKGPQGTLYGEGAQGGAIKILLNQADPSELYARGDVGFGQTAHSSGFNNFQNLALNVPLFDSWAVRLVGSRRIDQGFIDFTGLERPDADDASNLSARLHLNGEVWDGFRLAAVVLHQRQRLDQFPHANPDPDRLENENLEPQFSKTDFWLAGLTLDYDLGFVELTSSTSWFDNDRSYLARNLQNGFVGGLAPLVGAEAAGLLEPVEPFTHEWAEVLVEQFSVAQELRLVSDGDSWFRWITGFFFRYREAAFDFIADNNLSDQPEPAGRGYITGVGTERYTQYALFGEASVDLPWRLELTVGLRGLFESVALEGTAGTRGLFYSLGAADCGCPEAERSGSGSKSTKGFAPKVALSWLADEDRMLYVSASQGIRSGGSLALAAPYGVDPTFDPDFLWNYEVGAKTQWFGGILTVNVAAYHLDWQDLQVPVNAPANYAGLPLSVVVISNVGGAFSRGVEVETVVLPLEDLSLSFAANIAKGVITEGNEHIADGTPLPQLATLSYHAALDYQLSRLPVFGFVPTFHVDTSFVGDRTSRVPNVATGREWPIEAFQLVNARVGFVGERFDVTFGISNLTDVKNVVGGNYLENDIFTIGRPRTWLARLGYKF